MTIRGRALSSALVAAAGLLVLSETLYFASLRAGYSQVANTISELGEVGSPQARLVAFGFFLPVGLLVWLALWLAHREDPAGDASLMLAALSCLGTGYVVSVFFPCDPGAPLFGSWRTLVHNAAGFVDYAGTGLGFLLAARHQARRQARRRAVGFLAAGVLVLVCTGLLCLEAALPIRGAVQRVAEVAQFTGVVLVCAWLPE
jgi:hypothetical membrane protein